MEFSELQHVIGVEPIQLEPGTDKSLSFKQQVDVRLSKQKEAVDRVEISVKSETESQRNEEKLNIARQLLRKLPDEKAYIIYSSLARLKVTQYPVDEILSEVTSRLRDDL